jgi:hypothetical protein
MGSYAPGGKIIVSIEGTRTAFDVLRDDIIA